MVGLFGILSSLHIYKFDRISYHTFNPGQNHNLKSA